uniref:Target of rapamycin complex subunit lst8 n=1 Tax=Hirondellea gigas TaxID=1518452 RepID=A0A6A7G6M2_9CRUS
MPASVVLCSAGYDHTIRFWEAPTGLCYRSLQYDDSQINRLRITPDKQYIAAAANPHVKLFEINAKNPNPLRSFEGHSGNVTALGFQKDNKWMFTASEDASVKIWDVRAAGCQRDYESNAPINDAVLHPNQGEIFSGDLDGNVGVWDLTANSCSHQLVPDGKTPIRSVTIASDGSIVVAANNRGTIFVWKTKNGAQFEPVHKIDAHSTYCLKCVLSPDCKYLATTSADKTIKLWSVQDGFSLYKTLEGHTRWVWDVAWSADSAYVVSASSDKTAKLWEVSTGEAILEYTGHHKAVTSVALNDSSSE